MTTILDKIVAYKAEEVAIAKRARSTSEIDAIIKDQGLPRGFFGALAKVRDDHKPALIAEVKKASPSKGVIRADFDAASIAKAYECGGATCLSVLTDTPSFQGSPEDFRHAREAVAIPVLRKDFMIDIYQIAESRAMGADCILIIMACTGDHLATDLLQATRAYRMDALVEVHNEDELARALRLDARLIGINNRDLNSFDTRLETTERLAPLIPKDRIVVAESGINTFRDITRLGTSGAHAFLVGESLMRQDDIVRATQTLLGSDTSKTVAA